MERQTSYNENTHLDTHLGPKSVTKAFTSLTLGDYKNTQPNKSPRCQSPSSFNKLSPRRSAFSKKSNSSLNNNGESSDNVQLRDEQENEENIFDQINQPVYLKRINGDFDQRKSYEEIVLKILNEYQRRSQTHPANSDEFSKLFPKSPKHNGQKTLFIDLDDTLINVSLFQSNLSISKEVEIEEQSGKIMKMFLTLRTGAFEFLEKLSENFELVLFNNSSKAYTDAVYKVLKSLQPDKEKEYFSYVLNREECTINDAGHEIKNLNLFTGEGFNRDIKDCIIVDNNIYCFLNNLTNGLFIPKYDPTQTDDWLDILQHYIVEQLQNIEDVRTQISKDFNFESIVGDTRVSQIRKMMNNALVIEELGQN